MKILNRPAVFGLVGNRRSFFVAIAVGTAFSLMAASSAHAQGCRGGGGGMRMAGGGGMRMGGGGGMQRGGRGGGGMQMGGGGMQMMQQAQQTMQLQRQAQGTMRIRQQAIRNFIAARQKQATRDQRRMRVQAARGTQPNSRRQQLVERLKTREAERRKKRLARRERSENRSEA